METLATVNPEIQIALDPPSKEDQWESDYAFIEKLLSNPARQTSHFDIPPSKKDRGKPYLVFTDLKIVVTKSGAAFPVELSGIQTGDTIRTSVLYDHEDHQMERVRCNNPNSGHQSVFELLPRTQGLEIVPCPPYESGPCSVTLWKKEFQGSVATYRFEAKCLNSCSKVCTDRTLRLEHLNSEGMVLQTSNWKLRVCSIPKRDFDLLVAAVDPITGEKRKSLYSKVPGRKKVKLELEEQITAAVRAKYENGERFSSLDAKHEAEKIQAVANWVEDSSGVIRDVPSTSGQATSDDTIIHFIDASATTTPLLEEKITTSAFETVAEPSHVSPAPVALPGPFPIMVEMNSWEDDDLVRKLVGRLKGKVHELRLTSA